MKILKATKSKATGLLKTLLTNWRDIVVAGVIIVAVAFISDVIERLSITEDGMVWLTSVSNAFKGLASFAAANLACWFMLAVAWPSVNRWSNDGFKRAWEAKTDDEKFTVFLCVAIAELIAAALCYSS